MFSVIQDQQSRELSQGHIARRAKRLKVEQAELKLPRVIAMDACQVLLCLFQVPLHVLCINLQCQRSLRILHFQHQWERFTLMRTSQSPMFEVHVLHVLHPWERFTSMRTLLIHKLLMLPQGQLCML